MMHSELTFIILARTTDGEFANGDIPTLPMIGDVNIFLNGTPGDVDFESEAEIMIAGESALRRFDISPLCPSPAVRRIGADEDTRPLSLPESAYRRRGLASRALQLMFSYATASDSLRPLPVSKKSLVARIGDRNTASIALFQKLGFEITKHVAVFEETELRYTREGVSAGWLSGERRHYG
jgi:hypothetical protein